MSYIRDNLVRGEIVKYETKLHWIQYVNYIAMWLLGSPLIFSASSTFGRLMTALLLTLPFLVPIIRSYVTEMAVTNKRIIIKTGLIMRRTLELKHSKLESLSVDQGILGRVLGYGSVKISGTGSTLEVFRGIEDPLEFRRQVNQIGDSLYPPAQDAAALRVN